MASDFSTFVVSFFKPLDYTLLRQTESIVITKAGTV